MPARGRGVARGPGFVEVALDELPAIAAVAVQGDQQIARLVGLESFGIDHDIILRRAVAFGGELHVLDARLGESNGSREALPSEANETNETRIIARDRTCSRLRFAIDFRMIAQINRQTFSTSATPERRGIAFPRRSVGTRKFSFCFTAPLNSFRSMFG